MRRAASSTPSLGEYSSWSTETEDTGQSLHPPTHRVFREVAGKCCRAEAGQVAEPRMPCSGRTELPRAMGSH